MAALSPLYTKGIDCYLFTDNGNERVKGWITKQVPRTPDPVRQQREIKINFYKYLPGYDLVIYIDANFNLYRPISTLLRNITGDFCTVKHPNRNCVYEEGEAIIKAGKAKEDVVNKQTTDYKGRGIEEGKGMYATGLIIRRPTKECIAFCEQWYAELEKGSHRDQLAIMAAQHETGKHIGWMPWRNMCHYFKRSSHIANGTSQVTPRIWYSNPFNTNKNIGKALNEFCEIVPNDNDWIVIQDGDALYTTATFGNQIADVIKKYGERFALLGCMTNRIGGMHQRVPGMFEEWDFREHVKKGIELEKKHYAEVVEIKQGVSGFFMMFQKKTWKKYRFVENDHTFDTIFGKAVRKGGGRVGLMKGLYMMHMYRPLSDNPRFDISHLV
ncbi:MAG: glycosyltransferase domain-containing protein [Sphingobacterium sp.]